jgi:hypothetical protein
MNKFNKFENENKSLKYLIEEYNKIIEKENNIKNLEKKMKEIDKFKYELFFDVNKKVKKANLFIDKYNEIILKKEKKIKQKNLISQKENYIIDFNIRIVDEIVKNKKKKKKAISAEISRIHNLILENAPISERESFDKKYMSFSQGKNNDKVEMIYQLHTLKKEFLDLFSEENELKNEKEKNFETELNYPNMNISNNFLRQFINKKSKQYYKNLSNTNDKINFRK